MEVIEEQWRKQLYIEEEIEEAEKRKREKEKILGLRKTAKSLDRFEKEEENSEITNRLLEWTQLEERKLFFNVNKNRICQILSKAGRYLNMFKLLLVSSFIRPNMRFD